MSDIQRLKGQLYQLMTEAQQGAGSLTGFKQKFGQTSSQVQALIAGSATGADRDISLPDVHWSRPWSPCRSPPTAAAVTPTRSS